MRIAAGDYWKQGPPEPGTPINWDSDHADGLTIFWPCWEGKGWCLEELVHGRHAVQKVASSDSDANQPYWTPTTDRVWGNVPTISSGATGGNDVFDTALHPVFDLPKFTLSCWCNKQSATGAYSGPMQNRIDTSGQNGFQFVSENSGSPFKPHLVVINTANSETQNKQSTTTFAIPFVTFHHFVWTYDGTTVRLWIDGVEDALTNGASGWGGHNQITVGFAVDQFIGQVWDVRIYNRARPELGTELFDPGTRWRVFERSRVRGSGRSFATGSGGKLAGRGGGLVGGGLAATSSPLVA